MAVINDSINWAVNIANDNSHGYDQIHRWGPDYDCSSLIISAFEIGGGLKVKEAGASYTGNMRKAFEKCGFSSIKYKKGMTLQRGDIVLNEAHHVVLYIGDGKIVQASVNEKGTATGGKTGDQTGREIAVGNFYEYSKGWDYVLRYSDQERESVQISMPVLRPGDSCPEVGLLQTCLNALGFVGANNKKLTVDHIWGNNVTYAVRNFMISKGLTPDDTFGVKSWTALFTSDY